MHGTIKKKIYKKKVGPKDVMISGDESHGQVDRKVTTEKKPTELHKKPVHDFFH